MQPLLLKNTVTQNCWVEYTHTRTHTHSGKHSTRSSPLFEHGCCSCQEQEVCPGKDESRGKGCGWANERQKEGILIMYSCCEVSPGERVWVCLCIDTALEKTSVEKKKNYLFRFQESWCALQHVHCDFQINYSVLNRHTRTQVCKEVINGAQQHRPCPSFAPEHQTEVYWHPGFFSPFIFQHFCVIYTQVLSYSHEDLWEELSHVRQKQPATKRIKIIPAGPTSALSPSFLFPH